jgi:hypothetical protein
VQVNIREQDPPTPAGPPAAEPEPPGCVLCFDHYSDEGPTTPRFLPCGHTFCEECLALML